MKIIDFWREGSISLVISNTILLEYKNILLSNRIKNKYKISLFNIESFIKDIKTFSYFVKDDIFISCALISNCEYLISGDKDLLTLKNNELLGKLKIITPSEFINIKFPK